jgi:hypothetical protein
MIQHLKNRFVAGLLAIVLSGVSQLCPAQDADDPLLAWRFYVDEFDIEVICLKTTP